MRSIKRLVISFLIVSFSLAVLPKVSNDSSNTNVEQLLSEELGLDYKHIGDKTFIQNKNVLSISGYNNDGKLTNVSATNSSNQQKIVETEIKYDSNNKVENIQTLNQEISFNHKGDTLENVQLNGEVLFENEIVGNSITQEFANGTNIKKENLDKNEYSINYGSTSTYLIKTDSKGNPKQIINTQTNDTSTYSYDEDSVLTKYSNNRYSYEKNNSNIYTNYFGNKCVVKHNGNSTILEIPDGSNIFIFENSDEQDETLTLFNKNIISSDVSINANSNIKLYSNVLGDKEEYTYSKLGYLDSIRSDDNQLKNYYYDELGMLIKSENQKNISNYSYDNSGNLIYEMSNKQIKSYKYENASNKNQLTSVNDVTLKYDTFGNLINFGNDRFKWEAGSLLTNSIVNDVFSSYEYGVDKLRTIKIVDDQITNYQYLEGLLVASKNNNGAVQYIYDDKQNSLGFVFERELYLYVKDALGVIRGIVDSNLQPVIRYEYDDWGVPSVSFSKSKLIENINQIIYKDYVYDWESNLYYLGTRYYNPNIRRFISQDSLEKVNELSSNDYNFNLYSYCANNPIMLSDGNGYEPISLAVSSVLLIVGCVLALITAKLLTDAIMKVLKQKYKPYYPEMGNVFDRTENKLYNIVSIVKQAVNLAIAGSLLTIWMWWKKDNKKDELHHIIAKASPKAYTARHIYRDIHGFDLNKYPNIVLIKYRLHKHLHTDQYYNAINSYISLANLTNNATVVYSHVEAINITLFAFSRNFPL